MGCNYELRRNICPTCSHSKDTLHIGKSSWGWTFTFQGFDDPHIRSATDWKREMENGEIFDEYGEHITIPAFWRMVESKRGEKNNHAKQFPGVNWLDEDGNSFSSGHFS